VRHKDMPTTISGLSLLVAPKVRREEPGVWVADSPPALPLGASYVPSPLRQCSTLAIMRLTKRMLAWSARMAMRKLGFRPHLSLFYDPRDLLAIPFLPECVRVWRVFDELTLFPTHRLIRDAIAAIEERFAPAVDVIFASSRSQQQRRLPLNPRTIFMPNAADVAHYSQRCSAMPQEIACLPRPVIGFMGRISSKLDWKLVEWLVTRHREWTFVFVGPIVPDQEAVVARLRCENNVHFLEARPVSELPRYVQAWDVSIVPYVVNELTNTQYLIKIHELLAAGPPVVCTDLQEIRPLSPVVAIARTYGEFEAAIAKCLAHDTPAGRKARRAMAEANSWEVRVQQFGRVVQPLLEERYGEPEAVAGDKAISAEQRT